MGWREFKGEIGLDARRDRERDRNQFSPALTCGNSSTPQTTEEEKLHKATGCCLCNAVNEPHSSYSPGHMRSHPGHKGSTEAIMTSWETPATTPETSSGWHPGASIPPLTFSVKRWLSTHFQSVTPVPLKQSFYQRRYLRFDNPEVSILKNVVT